MVIRLTVPPKNVRVRLIGSLLRVVYIEQNFLKLTK